MLRCEGEVDSLEAYLERAAHSFGRMDSGAGGANDTVNAKNGKKETVNCGQGRKDKATVDKKDVVKGCETVKRARR